MKIVDEAGLPALSVIVTLTEREALGFSGRMDLLIEVDHSFPVKLVNSIFPFSTTFLLSSRTSRTMLFTPEALSENVPLTGISAVPFVSFVVFMSDSSVGAVVSM